MEQPLENQQASVNTDPKLRRAVEILIELCYRYGRDRQAETKQG